LSQEQVPSLLIQHLPNRLRFTLQQKIARAAQALVKEYERIFLWVLLYMYYFSIDQTHSKKIRQLSFVSSIWFGSGSALYSEDISALYTL
jgi:hypothetical protein